MRQGSFTLDNLMNYIYGEQISKIPAKLYNDDAQVKYLEFGSLYTYCCHGSKEHQIRRWLRERIAYVDSMLGYFTSQDDQVTIRMNKTGEVSFEVTPYIPLYFSVKWSNATGGTQTFKLKRGETKRFYYSSTTSTDQEVIIYHAKYIKRLDNLSNLNPSSCILSNAVKLTNVEIHSSELYNINVTNNKFLRSINLENCTALGTVTATGSSLNLSNCKYLRYCNVYNTNLTEVQLNTSGGSLTEIYYPKSIQSINLVKQRLLELVGLPYGENGSEIPTSLYTISIQECPSITKLNTSSDTTIASSFASMVYVNNLTIRNSLDLASLNFDGFHRLQNVIIENMYNLEEIGFNNLLPVGETSTIKYIGMSNCPKLGTIELNCTSNDYEITFADDAILNFGGLFMLKSITSNCVLKGIKTIIVPINLESMFFTNEYGSGYSTIENIWVSSQCNVDTQATTPIVTHVDSTYRGIDFLGMNLKNIDLGALVNIPKAINFRLSPTTVNPHFNLNRDGETYRYLQPVGTLDLSNYTESLARFFDGVDLDKLEIICNNNLPQTDLSYCFYNSTFSTNDAINKLLTKVSSITNLDYCFYRTTINSVDILDEINMGASSSMNYTFAECPNIKTLNNVVIPSTVTSVEGMFNKCPLTTITNMIVNVIGSISGLFKGCSKLTTINTLRIPNVTDVSNTFDGCTSLSSLGGFELPSSCTNVSNLFNGCYMLTELGMEFGANITAGDNWYPPNLETLHDTIISNDYVKLTNCNTLKTLNGVNISGGDLSDLFNGCTNLTNINGCTFNATTSLARAFKGCSKITINPITTIVDTVTNISEMYSGCTGITDISGMTFGSGITDATDWIKDCSIATANNVTINNDAVKFYGCGTLIECRNLIHRGTWVDKLFSGCTNLVDVSGLTLTNPIVMGGLGSGDGTFSYTSSLAEIDFANCNLTQVTNMNYLFYSDWSRPITIKNFLIPNSLVNYTGVIFRHNYTFDNLTIDSELKIFNSSATGNAYLTFNGVTITENVTDLSSYFEGATNLRTHIDFPSHITNCENCYKGCTGLTNIHANWNNSYDNGITSTDCYSGCTGIEYIDGESVILYPGDNSLDYIPKEWGGYGLVGEHTTVLEINIPSDNYELSLFNSGRGFIYSSSKDLNYYSENNSIAWGDRSYLTKSDILNDPNYDSAKGGISKKLAFPTHTYAKAGTYYIKGNFTSGGYGYSSSAGGYLTKCLNLASKSGDGGYLTSYNEEFNYCVKLTYVNLTSIKNNPLKTVGMLFNHCSSLTLDNIVGLDNLNLSNVTNMGSMFEYCSNITRLPFTTIPDSVTNIDNIFKNTGITDISGLTIGSGVTSATDWIKDCPITTANNITMKNNNTKFTGNSTLVSCTNFKITSNVTSLNQVFKDCPKLTEFSFSDESDFSNLIDLSNTFQSDSSLVTLNLSNVVCTSKFNNLNGLCYNCGSLTTLYLPSNLQDSSITAVDAIAISCKKLRTLYNLYLPDGFVKFGDYAFGWIGGGAANDAMNVIGFRVPNTTNPVNIFTKVCKFFKSFSNVIWSESATSIAGIFQGMINLTHDLEIPSHITNCTNAFKGCTGMTHIHSNWNNSYTNGITSTDCYAGCTGITHIDDKNVIAYEGDIGLDAVPVPWGGNGFTTDNSGIYEVEIPSNSYTIQFMGTTVGEGKINWGDGNVTTNESSHTYTTAGTYRIKSQIWHSPNNTTGDTFIDANLRATLTKVYRVPKDNNDSDSNNYPNSLRGSFSNCTKLTYVDISNIDVNRYTKVNNIFSNCTSLTEVVFPNGFGRNCTGVDDFHTIFAVCSSLETINVSNWDVSNVSSLETIFSNCSKLKNIIGLETWDTSNVINVASMFYGCSSLTTLNVSNWNTSKFTSMEYMFHGCTNLQTITGLENLDISNVQYFNSMFVDCSSLTKINLPITNFNGKTIDLNMFTQGTSSLTELDLSVWTNVTVISISKLFYYSGVTKFDFSTIDAAVQHLGYTLPKSNVLLEFKYFKSLTFTNLGSNNVFQNFTFEYQPNVSKESLVNFLNVLPDISSSGYSYTIPMGNTNKAKLTSSEIAMATNKGYSIS